MTVSIATTPQYLAAGNPSQIAFTLTAGGNFVRGYFVDAPLGSEAKDKLLQTGAVRLPAFDADASKPWFVTFETGGVYTLQLEEYVKGSALYGGGYQDSPDGFATETLIVDNFVTIAVGQKVTQKIGFGGDTATLTLFVVGNNIRATSYTQHGFLSPLIVDATTDRAKTAALNAGVVAAVAALPGLPVTAAIGDLATVYRNLKTNYALHITNGGGGVYHSLADTFNTPGTGAADSPDGMRRLVGKLLALLDQHMRNDDGGSTTSVGGTDSAAFHTIADFKNLVMGTSVGDTHDAFVGLADAWRAFDAHRLSTDAHIAADTFNAPTALPPILNVHSLFLAELQKQSPSAPPSVNAGVTALVHGAGFEEA